MISAAVEDCRRLEFFEKKNWRIRIDVLWYYAYLNFRYSMPMWLNWQSSWLVISRLSVRVRSSAFFSEILFYLSPCAMQEMWEKRRMNKTELQRIEEIFSFCERKTIPFCFILHLVYIASNVRAAKNEQNRTSKNRGNFFFLRKKNHSVLFYSSPCVHCKQCKGGEEWTKQNFKE